MKRLKKISKHLSEPGVLNYILPVLIVYLVLGTVAQKYIGLYQASEIFFSSTIIWLGPVPLPGLPILLGLMFLNIAFKLILKSEWSLASSGIILTHIGAMLLLVGGMFTAVFSQETFLDFHEGETRQTVSDYHAREFVLMDENGKTLWTFLPQNLSKNMAINLSPGFKIEILNTCVNCNIVARDPKTDSHLGMAQHMMLQPAPLKKQNEENMGGVTFKVTGSETDGIYLSLEDVPKLPEIKQNGKTYTLAIRKKQHPLPFEVTLVDFEKISYPGTEMAKGYRSRVRIKDGLSQWESEISMNQPLRYKGYTFFQSSFVQTPRGEMSVLAVVHNVGRTFPYISGIAMCLGLILHLFVRRRSLPKPVLNMLMIMTLITGLCQAQAQAQTQTQAQAQEAVSALPLEQLSTLPVLNDGRLKPLDTLARAKLKEFSGEEHIGQMSAMEWLAEIMFDPARAETRRIIRIRNPDLISLLGLKVSPNKLYTPKEVTAKLLTAQETVQSIIKVPQDDWTPAQRDLIELQEKLVSLNDLMSSFTLFLPLAVTLPQGVPLTLSDYIGKPLNYLEALKIRERVELEIKSIIAEKGQNIETYTEAEQALVFLSFSMAQLREKGLRSTTLKLIPATPGDKLVWLSPWNLTLSGATTPKTVALLEDWQKLAENYRNKNLENWQKSLTEIVSKTHDFSAGNVRKTAIELEYHYNKIAPFKIAFAFYVISALLLVSSIFIKSKTIFPAALIGMSSGLFIYMIGLGSRIYILQRPPVSTLYESILFVGVIAVGYTVLAYLRDKKPLWLWTGTTAAILLSLLGFSHDTDHDSMIMLTAVLNTNFWLATHVLCITAGYGFCIITSLLAHISLLSMIRNHDIRPESDLYQKMHTAALLALLFCTTGTVLGGIWADQSWGRFWGWDPKENGALLIVLWLIWIIHGRISGHMSSLTYTAGIAYLSVILAISWFGVNLLSIGLHAYGFTDAAAWIFWGFLGIETALVISVTTYIHLTNKNKRIET